MVVNRRLGCPAEITFIYGPINPPHGPKVRGALFAVLSFTKPFIQLKLTGVNYKENIFRCLQQVFLFITAKPSGWNQ